MSKPMRLAFAACLLTIFANIAISAGPPARVEVAVGARAGDGLFHLRYPLGNPVAACPATSGPLTLNASVTRATGVSPFLEFYDATATTDTAITGSTTVFQDVTFTWNFGDTGASGTSTWAYGAYPGVNTRNVATGGIAAHLYQTSGSDTTYNATVTASDGTNSVSCTLGATAYDPSGSNGFPTTSTTCVAAASTPVAGSGGCPAGATVLNTSSFATALGATYFGSGKRVLFKCGDTLTGDAVTLTGVKWAVGAYGGCEGTQTNRPIFSDTLTGGAITVATTSGDGRLMDIDFEGGGTGNFAAQGQNTSTTIPYQITFFNLLSNGNNTSYSYAQGAQWGIIQSVMNSMRTGIGMFLNYAENNPGTGGWASGTGPIKNLDYQAFLGNLANGAGGTTSGTGQETVRISACRLCAIENNTFQNANNVGAVLKLHNGNTYLSCQAPGGNCTPPCTVGSNYATTTCWTGIFTELIEMSDNLFTGTSGSQLVETTPQNNASDERIRNIVLERNLFSCTTCGKEILVSAVDETLRDNVMFVPSGQSSPPYYLVQVAQRGIEPVASANEFYNNTCYVLSFSVSPAPTCVAFSGINFNAPGTNSFAKNNLLYSTGAGSAAVVDQGTGNTSSNNTATPANNPSVTNGSTTFSILSDFKPTANYSGGISVPVIYDALGVAWSPTRDLGAVQH